MKQLLYFGLFIGLWINLPNNGEAQGKRGLTLAFYNVENLYDTIDDPQVDDDEFLPAAKSAWNAQRYQQKLKNLSTVIDSIGGGPSILGLCEVENRVVLEDLIGTERLRRKNYGIVHENSPDKRGIDVALLYRKKVFVPLFHKMIRVAKDDDPEFITRDIMLVKGLLRKKPMYIFINHWPSRRGGEELSEGKRLSASRAARFSVDSILKSNPNAAIVLMGDFNDEPGDSSIAKVLGASSMVDQNEGPLFNTMASLKARGDGSHSFSNKWHMLDQIIISKYLILSKKGIRFRQESSSVFRPSWLQDKNPKYQGSPFRTYAGTKYLGGYSDHFPVFCILDF